MNVILVPPADKELKSAMDQYDETINGLGARFYEEFKQSIELIKRTKYGWRKVGKNTRRFNMKRFPYLILYVVKENDLLITCVAH